MASFNLGDKFAPKTSSSTDSLVNPSAASISSVGESNFSTADNNKLQSELQEKLNQTGQLGNFQTSFVGDDAFLIPNPLDNATVSASQLPQVKTLSTTELRVIIKQNPAVGDGPNELVFKIMPRISEQGSTEYEAITPTHHPGAIQKYRSSSARTWNVSGRLMSRTVAEASENVKLLNMIRSWRMPFYGEGTNQDTSTQGKLGAPPPILTLSAYGNAMIGPVKCVLTSHNWDFDNAQDYMPTDSGAVFPVLLDVSLSFTESWSPAEFSGFDLVKFKSGDLSADGAFRRLTTSIPATQSQTSVSTDQPTTK